MLSKTEVSSASAGLQRDDVTRTRRSSDSHTVSFQSSGDVGRVSSTSTPGPPMEGRIHVCVTLVEVQITLSTMLLTRFALFKCSTGARHFPSPSSAIRFAPRRELALEGKHSERM